MIPEWKDSVVIQSWLIVPIPEAPAEEQSELEAAQDLILKAWYQFSVEHKGVRGHGSLSTLETIESYLLEHGMIDEYGNAVKRD